MSPTKQDPSIQHSPDFTTFRVFLQSPRLTQGDTKSKKLLQLGRRKSRATRYTAKNKLLHYYKPQYTLTTLRSSVRELYKQLQPRCTDSPQNIREWVIINAFQSCTVRNFILLIQTGDSLIWYKTGWTLDWTIDWINLILDLTLDLTLDWTAECTN